MVDHGLALVPSSEEMWVVWQPGVLWICRGVLEKKKVAGSESGQSILAVTGERQEGPAIHAGFHLAGDGRHLFKGQKGVTHDLL